MIRFFFIALVLGLLVSCTSDEPKKKQAQPPPGTGEYSDIGWTRPASWEGSSKFGGMMPQSH
jgi:hypothetical protein